MKYLVKSVASVNNLDFDNLDIISKDLGKHLKNSRSKIYTFRSTIYESFEILETTSYTGCELVT